MQDKFKLQKLYHLTSKHSNYQIIPSDLEEYLDERNIEVKSRNENERLKFFLQNVDINNKNILDIGGNTGYFTFEFLKHGAAYIDYYEGNKTHAKFVTEASKILKLEDKLKVNEKYFSFTEVHKEKKHDVILLLNVLHHIGDDYGDNSLIQEKVLENIACSLKNISHITNTLIFQLGFNWKGDPNCSLFKNGTKKEMIDFVLSATTEYYKIASIGIAEISNQGVIYNPMNDFNIERQDQLGEFLNRPIFILKTHA